RQKIYPTPQIVVLSIGDWSIDVALTVRKPPII
ncbi:unnamed protein product, partial [marine sediment metagenome]